MKSLMRTLTGLLLLTLALVCQNFAGQRNNLGPRQTSPAGWQLGQAVSHQNITVFPVIADQPASADEFITLEDGLRAGTVTVAELGSDGRARRLRPGQRASDNAEVNRVAVYNRSGKTLILIAGEILVGGKQDRIVSHDCMAASGPKPTIVDVFCVEHGRWNGEATFGQSRDVGSGTGRGIGRGQGGGIGSGEGRGVGAGRGYGAGGGSPGPGAVAETVTIVSPNVRVTAQAEKDQGKVWSEVDKTVKENRVTTATDAFTSVYRDESVSQKLAKYEAALRGVAGRNVIGAVVAVGGTVLSADVFASPTLFRKYWPKLLKSNAMAAINASTTEAQGVDADAARGFLSRPTGERAAEGKRGLYRITERQSDEDASFELISTGKSKSRLIHFNRMKK